MSPVTASYRLENTKHSNNWIC